MYLTESFAEAKVRKRNATLPPPTAVESPLALTGKAMLPGLPAAPVKSARSEATVSVIYSDSAELVRLLKVPPEGPSKSSTLSKAEAGSILIAVGATEPNVELSGRITRIELRSCNSIVRGALSRFS